MRTKVFCVTVLMVGVVGCKTDQAAKRAENIDMAAPLTAKGHAPDPATLGVISGTISFKGKAPERLKIDMSQDPVCSMTGGENLAEQYVVHDGKLNNVYVYVKEGLPKDVAFAAQTKPVVLDQKGCKYIPHVIAVQVGEPVEFRNSDPTMHNIHTMPAANSGVDVSQGAAGMASGAPQTKTFAQPEIMMPVRCNNHPWMNAFINVSATPFFAVTDADGHFELKGLPPGVYTIAAVHEKMGEQLATVTVNSQTTSVANFSYSQ